jgi:hypothetical protein
MSAIAGSLKRERVTKVEHPRVRRAPRAVRASLFLLVAILALACKDSGPTAPSSGGLLGIQRSSGGFGGRGRGRLRA